MILENGAHLTAAGDHFDAAGKGGAISLEAGAERNGIASPTGLLDVQSGSTIDLSVASATGDSAAHGDFTGTLHLRAPQTAAGTDLQLNPIDGTILGASSIVVEGYRIFTPAGGTINATVQAAVRANGEGFAGAAGTTTASYSAMHDRLLAHNASLDTVLSIQPGAELINPTGNLTLAANWDLSTFRFGPDNSPGVLTLRAGGNLIFTHKMSLSDGFGGGSAFGLWDAPLLAAGDRSWSYRLTAGADFTAADFHAVRPLSGLAANSGSLLLGNGSPALPTANANARSSIIPNFYQTIRTGTGSIEISAARDVQILNPLATIYTAGAQAPVLEGFDKPVLFVGTGTQNPIYPAQYSLGGGNVTISAQNDIGHFLVSGSGASAKLIADSTREMPTNWLYRRGAVDPATGSFATLASGEIASTTWWIDYSNFFEGVGALGGGNVSLTAGRNISNVDAVAPTNARLAGKAAVAGALLELGGGDVSVHAGGDIDGGVYYVERGSGTLRAEGSIHTNSTRAAVSRGQLAVQGQNATTWLPTTLFLGDGSFDVSARGDVLLGTMVNPFLLPQGVNNTVAEKTYFSTYAPESSVAVASLRGDITLRDQALGGLGSLYAWYQSSQFLDTGAGTFSVSQPWLRTVETTPGAFTAAAALMPSTLRATAFSGDIDLVGSLTLAPAPRWGARARRRRRHQWRPGEWRRPRGRSARLGFEQHQSFRCRSGAVAGAAPSALLFWPSDEHHRRLVARRVHCALCGDWRHTGQLERDQAGAAFRGPAARRRHRAGSTLRHRWRRLRPYSFLRQSSARDRAARRERYRALPAKYVRHGLQPRLRRARHHRLRAELSLAAGRAGAGKSPRQFHPGNIHPRLGQPDCRRYPDRRRRHAGGAGRSEFGPRHWGE